MLPPKHPIKTQTVSTQGFTPNLVKRQFEKYFVTPFGINARNFVKVTV